jgi:transcriptional regulator with GAF, ATPase, and Fis domain
MHWSLTTRYKILREINNAVIANTSKEGFFKALSGELRKHFYFDRLSIFLFDEDKQSLSHFTSAEGIQPDGFAVQERALASGAVANMVIQSRKPIIIDDLSKYSNQKSIEAMVKAGLKSTMAFPLIVQNRILGTLHLSFKRTPSYLSELSELLPDVSKQIAIAVGNMISFSQLVKEKQNLEREKKYLMSTSEDYQPTNFLYVSTAMKEIMLLVESVAEIDVSILITGETGTGKDFIARYIHLISHRKDHLFVKVNCPALAASLFESELFGHVKGAFTGADTSRTGRFELADKGTLFLDEIAELPAGLQAKLLQVLQEHKFDRVGDNRPVKANFRLISATNRNLSELIKTGAFRQDLLYRLNIFHIHVPPLRERKEDIAYLINEINKLQAKEMNRPLPKYTESAINFLCDYHWPGNVRELKNLIKRLVILKPGDLITISDLENLVGNYEQLEAKPRDRVVNYAKSEYQCIERALVESRGVVGGSKGAANLLEIPKSTLQYRLKKHGIKPSDYH